MKKKRIVKSLKGLKGIPMTDAHDIVAWAEQNSVEGRDWVEEIFIGRDLDKENINE